MSSEHSLEGQKIIDLLKVNKDWELEKYCGEGWSSYYDCITHSQSGIKVIPYNTLLSSKVSIAFERYSYRQSEKINVNDDRFLTKADHAVIYDLAKGLIKERKEDKSKYEKLRMAILHAQPSTCSQAA